MPTQAPGGRAGRLLQLLAVQHDQQVHVSTIVEALWPEGPPAGAERNVAALVSRLRRITGRDGISGEGNSYRLNTGRTLKVDLAEAEDLVATADRELRAHAYGLVQVAATAAERILAQATLLADEPDAPWVIDARARAARQLRTARAQRWTAGLASSDLAAAIDAAEAALRGDPLDEEACRTLMEAYWRSALPGAALAVYERLRNALAEDLGIDPAQQTQSLYFSILHREPAPGQPHPAGRRAASASDGLVGREAEISALVTGWSQAVGGDGGVSLVIGPAGIGKRALTDELAGRAEAAGALVLRTASLESERSLFLQPLIEIARGVLLSQTPAGARDLVGDWAAPLADLIPDLRHVIGPVQVERILPEAQHRQILEALAGLLARLERQRPVLLIVEELEHASEGTLEALHFLGSRVGGHRQFILVSADTTDAERVTATLGPAWPTVHLMPLDIHAVTELVHHTKSHLDPHRLMELTGGLPLYLTELIRHEKEMDVDDASDVPKLPASLQAAIRARMSVVGDEVVELLQLASIFGDRFTLEDVATLGELRVEECARLVQRAGKADLVVPLGSRFGFANKILREVVYQSIPEPTRVSRHRRAARLSDNPEAAAAHWYSAGELGAAVDAWTAAADRAHRALASAEAERLLTCAISAARRVADQTRLADALLKRGEVRSERGHYAQAHDDQDEALGIAHDLFDEALEARALEQLGWTALFARDALTAADLAARSTRLAEAAAAAPAAPRTAWLLLGRVRHWDGDYDGAVGAYDQVISDHPDDEVAAQALTFRGAVLQHLDRFDEARQTLARAIVLCRSNGLIRPLLQALFFTALSLGNSGDFSGALRSLQRARRLIDDNGITYYSAGIDTTMSWLLRETGQVHRAREVAERAVESAQRGGGALELEQGLHAYLAVADCLLTTGEFDVAGAMVEQAVPYLDVPLPYHARAHLRLLEMQCRFEPGRAEQLLELAAANQSAKYQALAYWHLGRGDTAAALARRTGSHQLIAQLGTPAESWQAIMRLAHELPSDQRETFLAAGRLPVQWRERTGRISG